MHYQMHSALISIEVFSGLLYQKLLLDPQISHPNALPYHRALISIEVFGGLLYQKRLLVPLIHLLL